jgi:hypothetical protein
MADFVPSGRLGITADISLEAVFPSDSLAALSNFLRSVPALAGFARELIQLRVVLDANEVQREIRFRLRRRQPNARSGLHEALAAGVVIGFVPPFLDDEIGKYVGKIARETKRSVDEVHAEWAVIRALLRVYDPQETDDPEAARIDPKDVPYKLAFDELGADAVLTQDKHFERMGVPVIKRPPSRALRDYARSTSISVGLGVSAGVVVTISYASLRGMYELIGQSIRALGELPEWAKVILAASVVIAVANPKSRQWLVEKWQQFRTMIGSITPELAAALETVARLYLEAYQTAAYTRATLEAALPPKRPRTVLQIVRVICSVNPEPLSVPEIAARMAAEGYVPDVKNFHRQLRQQLRASGQFIEISVGRRRCFTLVGGNS